MSKTTHTPGPWIHECGPLSPAGSVITCSGEPIAQTQQNSTVAVRDRLAMRNANARLIAAAPDLLAACLMVASKLTGHHRPTMADLNEMQAAVNAAIAKVDGCA